MLVSLPNLQKPTSSSSPPFGETSKWELLLTVQDVFCPDILLAALASGASGCFMIIDHGRLIFDLFFFHLLW